MCPHSCSISLHRVSYVTSRWTLTGCTHQRKNDISPKKFGFISKRGCCGLDDGLGLDDEHNDDRSSIPHPYSPAIYFLSMSRITQVAGNFRTTLRQPHLRVFDQKKKRWQIAGDCGEMVFSGYLLIITRLILFNSSSRSLTHRQGHNTLLWG